LKNNNLISSLIHQRKSEESKKEHEKMLKQTANEDDEESLFGGVNGLDDDRRLTMASAKRRQSIAPGALGGAAGTAKRAMQMQQNLELNKQLTNNLNIRIQALERELLACRKQVEENEGYRKNFSGITACNFGQHFCKLC
jgi:hypothetical protein